MKKPIAGLLKRDGLLLNVLLSISVPTIILICMEWIARGTLAPHKQGNGFFQALDKNFNSFFLAWVMLVAVYVFVSQLSGLHWLATFFVGLLGILPAVATHYKLILRGEPFLPWDLSQISDLVGVKESLKLDISPNIYISLFILFTMCFLAAFVHTPKKADGKNFWLVRFFSSLISASLILALMLGVFLSAAGSAAVGIREDMWMQDRYYRSNGVITGFLTNLRLLRIKQPQGYTKAAVLALAEETQNAPPTKPLFANSFAASGGSVSQPDIIFLMAESFWDVTTLPGIEYDQPLTPNMDSLARQGAFGFAHSPSFGGGTCDVEFEALTGFSMENLPAGSKPYQQYITEDTFALPHILKDDGYKTVAIHGYGRKFWNRDTAYPRLGIDTFIASEDFVEPEKKRGFISDNAMVDRIIEEYENRPQDQPMFIHAVTMQNHTTYNRNKYPQNQLVQITKSPASLGDATIGQLEDCATGIREMDAALGRLCAYLKTTERPTILVFWGDHLNPMSDGYNLFEKTGFIEKDDTASYKLHQTPLLFWSNFSNNQVDIGTISTYNISPLLMDLYGLEKPLYFNFLTRQMPILHGRTKGITINPNGLCTEEISPEQAESCNKHAILQYDYLFGEKVMESLE